MRKSIVCLFLSFVALNTFAFEGTIKMKYQDVNMGDASKMSMTWHLGNGKVKMQIDATTAKGSATTCMIPSLTDNKLSMYVEGSNSYYSIPFQDINKGQPIPVITLEKTAETKMIAGYSCEKIIARNGNRVTEAWVAKNLSATFYQFAAFFKANDEMVALANAQMAGFPLAATVKDASGKVTQSYEAELVKEGTQSAETFAVPSNYKLVSGGK